MVSYKHLCPREIVLLKTPDCIQSDTCGFILKDLCGTHLLFLSSLTHFGWVTLQIQPDVLRRQNMMGTFSTVTFCHEAHPSAPAAALTR